jgi:hypothetical protein
LKYKDAVKGIKNCVFTWVDEGKSVRCLTVAEQVKARKKQEETLEPLPYYEIPGVFYKPSSANEKSFFASHRKVWEAHAFMRDISPCAVSV